MRRLLTCWLFVLLLITAYLGASKANADQLIPYCQNGKIGYVDMNMEVRIPAAWDYGSYFRNGETAIVRIDADLQEPKYGLIDADGAFLVPLGNHRINSGEGG